MSAGTAHHGFLLRIDQGLCQVCGECAARRKCRSGAIRIIDRGEAPVLDTSLCLGCLLCTLACPNRAVVRFNSSA